VPGPRKAEGKLLGFDFVGPVHLVPKGGLGVAHAQDSVGQLGLKEAGYLGLASKAQGKSKGRRLARVNAVSGGCSCALQKSRVVKAPGVTGIVHFVCLPGGSLRIVLIDLAAVRFRVAGGPSRALLAGGLVKGDRTAFLKVGVGVVGRKPAVVAATARKGRLGTPGVDNDRLALRCGCSNPQIDVVGSVSHVEGTHCLGIGG